MMSECEPSYGTPEPTLLHILRAIVQEAEVHRVYFSAAGVQLLEKTEELMAALEAIEEEVKEGDQDGAHA